MNLWKRQFHVPLWLPPVGETLLAALIWSYGVLSLYFAAGLSRIDKDILRGARAERLPMLLLVGSLVFFVVGVLETAICIRYWKHYRRGTLERRDR